MKWLLGIVLSVAVAGDAMAAFDYSFEAALASNPTTLGNVAFGDGTTPISLNLYLVQRPTGGDVPTAFSSLGATFNLNHTAGGATPAPSSAGSAYIINSVDSSMAPTYRYTNANFPPPVGMPQPSTLFNGLQTIQVGSLAVNGPLGSTATFTFSDVNMSANDVQVNGANIEPAVFNNSSAFTVAVPEPSSLVLLTLGSCLAFARRRRA